MPAVTPVISRGGLSFPITGQTSHANTVAGALAVFKNPEDCPIIIKSCFAYITANSTGACNLTVGHATTAIGAHDTTQLFTAAAMAAAADTAVTGIANGDVADSLPIVPDGSYIGAWASADSSGLAGVVYIDYVRYPD